MGLMCVHFSGNDYLSRLGPQPLLQQRAQQNAKHFTMYCKAFQFLFLEAYSPSWQHSVSLVGLQRDSNIVAHSVIEIAHKYQWSHSVFCFFTFLLNWHRPLHAHRKHSIEVKWFQKKAKIWIRWRPKAKGIGRLPGSARKDPRMQLAAGVGDSVGQFLEN